MITVDSTFTRRDRPDDASLSAILGTVIVKWDRFYGDVVRHLAEQACPRRPTLVCHTGADALAALRRQPMRLGLFGLTLPDMDGLDLLSIVIEEQLVERLLVISGRRDERVRQVLRYSGVHGLFECAVETPDALVPAIQRVDAGGHYFSAHPERHATAAGTSRPELYRLLSTTELQVFAVIGGGCDDREAGERLGLSAKTVHWHRQRIMRKLGVQTRTELMLEALQRGIVRVTPDRVLRPGFERTLRARALAEAVK